MFDLTNMFDTHNFICRYTVNHIFCKIIAENEKKNSVARWKSHALNLIILHNVKTWKTALRTLKIIAVGNILQIPSFFSCFTLIYYSLYRNSVNIVFLF